MNNSGFYNNIGSVMNDYESYSNKIDNIVLKSNDLGDVTGKILSLIKDRHTYTYGHSKRVTIYSRMMAESLGYNKHDLKILTDGALLHDTGKLAMPLSILNLDRDIKPEEYEIIKLHPFLAAKFLHDSMFNEIRLLVLTHHEKEDGTGYPLKINRDSINENAKILSIADAFDAMTTQRTYNVPMTIEEAMDSLIIKSKQKYVLEDNHYYLKQQFNEPLAHQFIKTIKSNINEIEEIIHKKY